MALNLSKSKNVLFSFAYFLTLSNAAKIIFVYMVSFFTLTIRSSLFIYSQIIRPAILFIFEIV